MRKILLVLFVFCVFVLPNIAKAEMDGIGILEDLVVDDEEFTKEGNAIDYAKKLMEETKAKPEIVDETGNDVEANNEKNYGDSAPFGLYWGETSIGIKNKGVTLEKDNEIIGVNNYSARYLPKPIKEIEKVMLDFGDDDRLWKISAISKSFDDNVRGDTVIRYYRRFGDLLAQKYPDNKEFYKPKVQKIEAEVEDKAEIDMTVNKVSAIGEGEFLTDIASGETQLYRVFRTDDVEVTLSVESDENNRSYFTLLYKSNKIIRNRDSEVMDAL